ncbi:MAG: hypothetical protein QOE24_502 [Frankiales bacterium]|jgi:hypothetical protein|nr:hypothetical protein [Frankiales bacterium]MDX6221349.1 hypothetical protein [Frankiales bacterium]
MSSEDLATLLASAVDDTRVRERLLPLRQQAFTDSLIAVAAERGLQVEPADVEAATGSARRTWWERWV